MSYTGKIKIDNDEFPVAATLYGTCSSLAAATEKAVVLANFDTLMEGVAVAVKFVYGNTATNPTLNVNGTGAKPIYKFGTTAPGNVATEAWNANSIVTFGYDGTSWMMTGMSAVDFNASVNSLINSWVSSTNPNYNNMVSSIIADAFDTVYPVGCVYHTETNANPATTFGFKGTWVYLGETGGGDYQFHYRVTYLWKRTA